MILALKAYFIQFRDRDLNFVLTQIRILRHFKMKFFLF